MLGTLHEVQDQFTDLTTLETLQVGVCRVLGILCSAVCMGVCAEAKPCVALGVVLANWHVQQPQPDAGA